MRIIALNHLLPVTIAVCSLIYILPVKTIPSPNNSELIDTVFNSQNNILLIGSSELTGEDPFACKPFNFITNNTKYNCYGIGNSGFQSTAILAKLYPVKQKLRNSKIVLIVSPGWFQSNDAFGTSTEIFLNYLSQNELGKLNGDDMYSNHIADWVNKNMNQINNASNDLKLIYYNSFGSIIKNTILALPYLKNKIANKINRSLGSNPSINSNAVYYINSGEDKIIVPINFDSIFNSLIKIQGEKYSNKFHVDNILYESEYAKVDKKIRNVPISYNQELADFKILVDFLNEYKANVCLIVQPQHPLIYSNLKDMDEEMVIIREIIQTSKFPTLDLFTTDASKYDINLLKDAMHLSDYGCMKLNKFILDTYGNKK